METLKVDVSRRTTVDGQEMSDSWEYLYKKPDKLKVLYKGRKGGLLVTDGREVWQYLPHKKKAAVYREIDGMPEKEKASVFNKVFGPVTLVGLRVGLPEAILAEAELSLEEPEVIDGREAAVITVRPKEGTAGFTRVWIDRERNCLLKSEVYSGDETLQSSIQASRFREVDEKIWFPSVLRLMTSREGQFLKTEMNLSNISYNKMLGDKEFEFTPPEGTDIIEF
jgi:outer membrane lipoprotein-sorting protein